MNTSVCIYLVSSFLTLPLQDTTATMQGTIIDATSRETIFFATISIYKEGIIFSKTTTDNEGFFSIKNVPYGNYVLEIEHVGMHKETIRNFIITDQSLPPLQIIMREKKLLDDALDVAGDACVQGLSKLIKKIFKKD